MPEAPGSLSHLAYLALEHLIVTLKLRPEALVTEKQLIDLAGQGRTPVREAIQKLAWQGLIIVRPRVGMQIAGISPQDHDHIMQVRRGLEPISARLVARYASEEQRSQLLTCAQTMTACAVGGDLESFLAADKTFDDIMEAACPNTFLTSALTAPQTHFRRIWFSSATQEKMDRSISLHVSVIRAVRQNEGAAAAKAMETLIDYLSRK